MTIIKIYETINKYFYYDNYDEKLLMKLKLEL